MSLIAEAIKGAKVHVAAAPTFSTKLQRFGSVTRILLSEIAGIASMAPYGLRTMKLYWSLPALTVAPAPTPPASSRAAPQQVSQQPHKQHNQTQQQQQVLRPPSRRCPLGVVVHRDIKYGPLPRCTLDVYVPEAVARASAAASYPASPSFPSRSLAQPAGSEWDAMEQGANAATAATGAPVVFFVHGGVWSSGEKWHYAPMAVRMAQEGCVVVVITYTLYPEALADQMVWEVSRALSWTLDNAACYGGDPGRVYAVGHSAGGHLVSMALLTRAIAAERQTTGTLSLKQQQQQEHAHAELAYAAATVTATAASLSASPAPLSSLPLASADSDDHSDSDLEGRDLRGDQGSSRPSTIESASYLMGAGTSVAGAAHTLAAVAHAQTHSAAQDVAQHRQDAAAMRQQQQQGHGVSGSCQDGLDSGGGFGSGGGGSGATEGCWVEWWADEEERDARMPHAFIGMSAVYDIAKHYEFERMRGVHEISMMKRAMGGKRGFDAFSPTVILARAAASAAAATSTTISSSATTSNSTRTGHATSSNGNGLLGSNVHSSSSSGGGGSVNGGVGSDAVVAPGSGHEGHVAAHELHSHLHDDPHDPVHFFNSFPLLGEAIPARAGLMAHPSALQQQQYQPHSAAETAGTSNGGLLAMSATNGGVPSSPLSASASATATAAVSAGAPSPRERPCVSFSASAARHLPPHVIMGSCADHMVPWHEGAALCDSLRRVGVPHKQLIYNHTLHSDFALAWPLLPTSQLSPLTSHHHVHQLASTPSSTGASAAASPSSSSLSSLPVSQLVKRRRRGLQPFVQDFLKLVSGEVDVHAACSPTGMAPRL